MSQIRRLLIVGAVVAVLVAVGAYITVRENGITAAVPAEVSGGDAHHGRLVFVKYGCGGCHRIPGVATARGLVGPPLDSLGERTYIAGNLANTPENLVRWIVDPQGVEPGTAMPDLRVTEEDAWAMTAYLYGISGRRSEGDR